MIKLELTPREFIAVYKALLISQPTGPALDVATRMTEIMYDAFDVALRSEEHSKFTAWAEREEKRLSALERLRASDGGTISFSKKSNDGVVTLDQVGGSDPTDNRDYPKRPPSMPRAGKRGGFRTRVL